LYCIDRFVLGYQFVSVNAVMRPEVLTQDMLCVFAGPVMHGAYRQDLGIVAAKAEAAIPYMSALGRIRASRNDAGIVV
jgi:hypothetical protein